MINWTQLRVSQKVERLKAPSASLASPSVDTNEQICLVTNIKIWMPVCLIKSLFHYVNLVK